MEIWKDIKDLEGFYQVSTWGRVRSVDRMVDDCYGSKRVAKGQIIKPYKSKKGYLKVTLYLNKKEWKKKRVHRLVAEAFIENPFNYPEVNHIDGNKENNSVTNLEWCTGEYNRNHAKMMRQGILRNEDNRN